MVVLSEKSDGRRPDDCESKGTMIADAPPAGQRTWANRKFARRATGISRMVVLSEKSDGRRPDDCESKGTMIADALPAGQRTPLLPIHSRRWHRCRMPFVYILRCTDGSLLRWQD